MVNSWSDHRGNCCDAGFSNDASPKIGKPCHRVTVVGAERSIPLRGTRTFCEGPAELQPHILGPAVLREQQILYHGLRRIARRGGIFFADPVLRGRLPAMRIHGGAGAGVRRSAGKIPAVWSGGHGWRFCPVARLFVGVNPADTPSAGAPWRPFRLGGCPAAVPSGGPALRPWVAVLPCGRTFVGVNPADTPSAGAPGGRSVWGLPGGRSGGVRGRRSSRCGGRRGGRPGWWPAARRR